jgi:hypothetical protein
VHRFEEDELNPEADVLRFTVMDWEKLSKDDPIGYVEYPVGDVATHGVVDTWVPLTHPKHDEPAGEILLQFAYGDENPLPPPHIGLPVVLRFIISVFLSFYILFIFPYFILVVCK